MKICFGHVCKYGIRSIMIMMMIIAMNGDDNIDGDDDCQNTDENDLDFND